MNGRTARLLRRHATAEYVRTRAAVSDPHYHRSLIRKFKREWNKLPRPQRHAARLALSVH